MRSSFIEPKPRAQPVLSRGRASMRLAQSRALVARVSSALWPGAGLSQAQSVAVRMASSSTWEGARPLLKTRTPQGHDRGRPVDHRLFHLRSHLLPCPILPAAYAATLPGPSPLPTKGTGLSQDDFMQRDECLVVDEQDRLLGGGRGKGGGVRDRGTTYSVQQCKTRYTAQGVVVGPVQASVIEVVVLVAALGVIWAPPTNCRAYGCATHVSSTRARSKPLSAARYPGVTSPPPHCLPPPPPRPPGHHRHRQQVRLPPLRGGQGPALRPPAPRLLRVPVQPRRPTAAAAARSQQGQGAERGFEDTSPNYTEPNAKERGERGLCWGARGVVHCGGGGGVEGGDGWSASGSASGAFGVEADCWVADAARGLGGGRCGRRRGNWAAVAALAVSTHEPQPQPQPRAGRPPPLLQVTFPGVWTNTCCSHPLAGQAPDEVDLPAAVASGQVPGIKAAAVRKLQHELGIPPEQVCACVCMYVCDSKRGWRERGQVASEYGGMGGGG